MSAADTPKIVHFLYEPGDGGLDRVAVLLANEMAEQGRVVELWMARGEGPVADLISDRVTVRIIPGPRLGGRGLHLIMQIPALARQITASKPAVLFSAGNQSNLTIALARMFSRHKPAIIQKITNPVERRLMGALPKFLRRLRFGMTARAADVVLCLSAPDAQRMSALFPKIAKRFAAVKNAYVTPAMLDVGTSRPARAGDAAPKLLAVGRLAVQKDYDTLMQALGQIKHLPWSLTVLGDGPLMQPVRATAEMLGMAQRIDFKGYVTDPTAHYAASDILVLSSRWEGFPAVPLEAMAAGCDVVATDCSPGLSDILAGAGRKTVPIQDRAALADAIEAAIARADGAAVLGEAAQAYSIANSARDHLRIAAPFFEE